jgi:hypothetical protein
MWEASSDTHLSHIAGVLMRKRSTGHGAKRAPSSCWLRRLGGRSAGSKGRDTIRVSPLVRATVQGHVIYESRLELARFVFADFDKRVKHIVAQPFLLRVGLASMPGPRLVSATAR